MEVEREREMENAAAGVQIVQIRASMQPRMRDSDVLPQTPSPSVQYLSVIFATDISG